MQNILNKISLIVTTYNRPDALEAVLIALSQQTDKNFEVIIADDGSKPETAELIKRYQQTSAFLLKHIWQPDDGFRAAQIRNKGIIAASGEYIIFLDGDCLPRKHFIARHRQLAEVNWFVTGNRVLMARMFTEELLRQPATLYPFTVWRCMTLRLQKKLNRLLALLNLPLGSLRKLKPSEWRGVRTCNLAAWKKDLLSINGFDESYSGWGYEDSDLAIRLLRAGVKCKSGRFATAVFHLWHAENDRSQEQINLQRLKIIEQSTTIFAIKGLNQYEQ